MLLKGYIDESYNDEVFTLSCLFASLKTWTGFEMSWNNCLRTTNNRLLKAGRRQITRYHATDCANLKREYADWSVPEQIAFTKSLITVFDRHAINIISYSVYATAFRNVFPEFAKDWRRECYGCSLKFLMLEVAEVFYEGEQLARGAETLRITLNHDRGPFDETALSAFHALIEDKTFNGARFFEKIVAKSWEECVPLQAADLLAYESRSESISSLLKPRRRKKSMEALLATKSGGKGRVINEDALRKLRERTEPILEKRRPNSSE